MNSKKDLDRAILSYLHKNSYTGAAEAFAREAQVNLETSSNSRDLEMIFLQNRPLITYVL
jgi:hypothetical protein